MAGHREQDPLGTFFCRPSRTVHRPMEQTAKSPPRLQGRIDAPLARVLEQRSFCYCLLSNLIYLLLLSHGDFSQHPGNRHRLASLRLEQVRFPFYATSR